MPGVGCCAIHPTPRFLEAIIYLMPDYFFYRFFRSRFRSHNAVFVPRLTGYVCVCVSVRYQRDHNTTPSALGLSKSKLCYFKTLHARIIQPGKLYTSEVYRYDTTVKICSRLCVCEGDTHHRNKLNPSISFPGTKQISQLTLLHNTRGKTIKIMQTIRIT